MTTAVFGQDYAEVYDSLYENKQYAAEAEYVRALLTAAGVVAGDVLELGSGTGIHGQLLARAGYRVHGVERSPAMAAASERRAADAKTPWSVTVGDARDTCVPGAWDACLALFHVVSYQASDDDLDRLLANVSSHLRDGGVFLFDVWHADAVLAIGPTTRVKRVSHGGRKIVRIAEPEMLTASRCVVVRYTLFEECDGGTWRSSEEEHLMRYLSAAELRDACAKYGLVIERAEEWMTGAPPSDESWGVCYVARKTAGARR